MSSHGCEILCIYGLCLSSVRLVALPYVQTHSNRLDMATPKTLVPFLSWFNVASNRKLSPVDEATTKTTQRSTGPFQKRNIGTSKRKMVRLNRTVSKLCPPDGNDEMLTEQVLPAVMNPRLAWKVDVSVGLSGSLNHKRIRRTELLHRTSTARGPSVVRQGGISFHHFSPVSAV